MLDLQLHTSDSDGTWPWDQVLERCRELKLTAFAITDHDTIARCDEIRTWARKRKALAIPGVEISCIEKNQTVHLLGYFLEGSLTSLEAQLAILREGRKIRNAKMIAKLQSLGVFITEAEAWKVAGQQNVIGRPHIAKVLMDKGVVGSIQEAFNRYLTPGGLAYVPKDELPLRQGIDLLHGAGAVTSLAHPGLLRRNAEALEESLKEWKSWGLDAVEGIYPAYNREQTAFFQRMADKYGFLLTGGSDFHGDHKPLIKIGVGTGHLNVPDDFYRRFWNDGMKSSRESGSRGGPKKHQGC